MHEEKEQREQEKKKRKKKERKERRRRRNGFHRKGEKKWISSVGGKENDYSDGFGLEIYDLDVRVPR